MDKIKKYILWLSLLVTVSCSNISNLCSHAVMGRKDFKYSQHPDGSDESLQDIAFAVNQKSLAEPTAAPTKIQWDLLKNVTFQLRFSKELDMDINYPVFGASLQKLKGKELYITGYLIPLNPAAGLYAISKNNYASCFFCGRAGPESIISLKFSKKPRSYKTDEYLTMKGKLELNDTNIRDFIYIFRETEEYTVPK